jgi:hypothetical protein
VARRRRPRKKNVQKVMAAAEEVAKKQREMTALREQIRANYEELLRLARETALTRTHVNIEFSRTEEADGEREGVHNLQG